MQILRRTALYLSPAAALLILIGLIIDGPEFWQASLLVSAILLSLGLGAVPTLKGYQYTGWIMAAVIAGLVYPAGLLDWGGIDLRHPWLILIVVQLVMFGMGTQMRLSDFRGVARSPRGVAVGLVCQFSIMPFVGFLLTRIFEFPGEIAAGVILLGCCSSGLASNVMTFLARANLALSVTVTAMATVCAPLVTPFLMEWMAGELIAVSVAGMMVTIIQIVVVPIGAAMLRDYLREATATGRKVVYGAGGGAAVWLVAMAIGGWAALEAGLTPGLLRSASMVGFLAGATLVGIGYYHLTERSGVFDRLMPYVSMGGIIYFTAVTTAAGRDDLLRVGFLLFLAAVIHNTAGYVFGYWISRALGLDRDSARAMALEVGLQNGGMASGIAGSMGKLGTVGLASAVFSPWMNISGSILANYWQKHPVDSESAIGKIPPRTPPHPPLP